MALHQLFYRTILVVIFLGWPCHAVSEQVVSFNNDRLTLDVVDMPLSQILAEFTSQGVHVKIDETINPNITSTFSNQPVDQVFNRILKDYNHALVWEKTREGETEIRLAEIQVFHREKSPPTADSENNGNLDIVMGPGGSLVVRNTVLIHLRPGYSQASLKALLAPYNTTLVEWNESVGIAKLSFPDNIDIEAVIDRLVQSADVKTAEPDYAYPLPGGMVPFGPTLSKDVSFANNPAGNGSPIAVLDSGLSQEYLNSPFLLGSYDALSPGSEIHDNVGHGTQMALIAAGAINPVNVSDESSMNNSVLAIRAFDDNGFTSTFTLLRSIDYALQSGARVLSMSWGSEAESPMLETAINYASDNGLVLVAAVGNEPTGVPVYPAAYQNVVGVGAVMPDGNAWSQSNFGSFVTLQAPGLADFPVGHNGSPGTYAGTSISTAYTAGKIAEVLDRTPDADVESILQELTASE